MSAEINTAKPDHKVRVPVLLPLPPRQEQLLKFMGRHYREVQYLPSHREMADHLQLNSTNVHAYVQPLVRRGYVARQKSLGRKRNLQLTLAGVRYLMRIGEPFSVGKNGEVKILET